MAPLPAPPPPFAAPPPNEAAYGEVRRLSPLIRRVLAPNPGPFTYTGTGVYIVGNGDVAIIDPGPVIPEHFQALRNAIQGERLRYVLVTHTHSDHSPLARPLAQALGAQVIGAKPHAATEPDTANPVEEGADRGYAPDSVPDDGQTIQGKGWTIEAVHTPGHTSNHIAFALREENALFSGDHVMKWSTTVIAPPDGNMETYLASLRLLLERKETIYYPTHGEPLTEPRAHVRGLLVHRAQRETQIAAAINDGLTRIPAMVKRMYAAVDPRLHPAAGLSTLAHLIRMRAHGIVACDGTARLSAEWRKGDKAASAS